MGGSSKKATIGYKYFIGAHKAICHGPVDSVSAIEVDGRVAWTGLNDGTDVITVNSPELFGGKKAEGGISGEIDIEMGYPTQVENAYLQSQLGDDIPAFRGILSAILKQCYMGNNPYLKPWAFQVSRIHVRQNGITQWYDEKSAIINKLVSSENEAIECNDFACDALEIALLNTPGIFSVGYFTTTLPNIWGDDVTGLNNDWQLETDISPLVNYLVEDGAPASCNDSYMHTITGTANPVNWIPQQDVPYTGSRLSIGAVIRQHDPGGGDEVPLLAISRFREAGRGFRFNWVRSSNQLNLYSFDSRESPAFKNDALSFAPPPEGTWFFVHLEVNLTAKTAKVDLAYLDAAGEPVIESQGLSVYHEETIPWQFGAVCAITNIGGGDFEAKYDYMTGWLIEGQASPTPELIAQFFNSDIDYVRPELCYVCSDMNPAHIVRECHTDPTWGMGYQDADIDDTAFMAAADQLYTEDMGMSFLWDRQIPLEDFVLEVLRHIDAVLYVSRTTGKFVLKLIREEVVDGNTVVLDESNTDEISSPDRAALGELISSVTVQFYDGAIDEEGSLTVHNAALEQAQGVQSNDTRQYPGFTNRALAERVAIRDLKALSTPLLSIKEIPASRVAQGLNIGDLFVLNLPNLRIFSVPMRVTAIDLGDGIDNTIRISALEDAFGLPSNLDVNVGVPSESWVSPVAGDPLEASPRLVTESPYYELVKDSGQLQIDTILADEDMAGFLLVAAGRQGAELDADLLVDSGAGYEDSGTLDFAPYTVLDADISYTDTRFYIDGGMDLDLVEVGTIAQINDELLRVDATGTDGTGLYYDFGRGVLDTVPAGHVTGDSIIFWDASAISDETQYTATDSVDVKLTTALGSSRLSESDAPEDTVVMDSRAIRPYAPGDFQIGGQSYNFTHNLSTTMPILTWKHRDRSQQTGSALLDYTDGDVGPEAGTTYLVESDAVLLNATVTTGWFSTNIGAGNTYDTSAEGSPPADTVYLRFRVKAIRSAHESWQFPQSEGIWDTGLLTTDPDFADVASLLHFENSIVDVVPTTTWAIGGNAAYDATNIKFGTHSLDMPLSGTPTCISTNIPEILSQDFTLELFVRRANVDAVGRVIIETRPLSNTSTATNFALYSVGTTIALFVNNLNLLSGVAASYQDGNFHHIALSRDGSTIRLFFDGVQIDSATNSAAFVIGDGGMRLGCDAVGGPSSVGGQIDDFRCTLGTARYTAAFTPTAAPFPDSA